LTTTHSTSLPGLTRQSIPQAFQLDRPTEWMPGSVAGHDGWSR
jgi:hypothetical protein